MHGEYKVPGGKLVVADLSVENGKLSRVQISGDFFLEPPEILDEIDRALNGLPADASQAMLCESLQAALPRHTQMFGFSVEAVAIAVKRALS